MSSFKEDRIENEKNEPSEASSLKYINVPLVLIALLLGFGITYLALKTDKVTMEVGDSRTEPSVDIRKEDSPTDINKDSGKIDISKLMEKGKQVYTTTCQACHQATGAGIESAFPPLTGSEWATGSRHRLAAIVLHGIQGEITVNNKKYNSVMPPFKDQLSDEDIASVTTYIRNSFGNTAEPVTPEIVAKVREDTKDKTGSWAGEQELNSKSWD
ncbi:MAG: hypothetical protein CL676_00495 [Bdellovibrionaceae bacterium]|nr:hypothetical protein [Pseudobdellovibrionaceae bacterium]|tara:strand:+ start:5935 stop:6576 length:642 start_codon:yes stop_codon:yes gene_type:complete